MMSDTDIFSGGLPSVRATNDSAISSMVAGDPTINLPKNEPCLASQTVVGGDAAAAVPQPPLLLPLL